MLLFCASFPCWMLILVHAPGPYCMSMNMLHVEAVNPCFIHASNPCCMSMLHVFAACPCCMSKVYDEAECSSCFSMLHVYGACPCNMYMLHVRAVCPCRMPMSMLHLLSICPYSNVYPCCWAHAACPCGLVAWNCFGFIFRRFCGTVS
jgi:hypothetical protein